MTHEIMIWEQCLVGAIIGIVVGTFTGLILEWINRRRK